MSEDKGYNVEHRGADWGKVIFWFIVVLVAFVLDYVACRLVFSIPEIYNWINTL